VSGYVWLVMAIDYEHQAVLSIHYTRAGAEAAETEAKRKAERTENAYHGYSIGKVKRGVAS
jgi:hypothetical protein